MSESKAAKATREAERRESIAALRRMGVKEGTKVYTNVTQVARSGMSRHITVHVVSPVTRKFDIGGHADGTGSSRTYEIRSITFHVARILGYKRDAHTGALKVGGCGMDMGFAVVYELSAAMFRGKDRAGYVLKQEWI